MHFVPVSHRAFVVTIKARTNVTSPRETFARLANGTMVGWGYGCDGTLGSDMAGCSTTSSAVPLNNLATTKQIAAGSVASCALNTDGTVFCWGPNYFGQVGDNTYTTRNAGCAARAAWPTAPIRCVLPSPEPL